MTQMLSSALSVQLEMNVCYVMAEVYFTRPTVYDGHEVQGRTDLH